MKVPHLSSHHPLLAWGSGSVSKGFRVAGVPPAGQRQDMQGSSSVDIKPCMVLHSLPDSFSAFRYRC